MLPGNYGVLLATFTADGVLDYDLYMKEIEHCLTTGLTGLMISGSTGEFPYISTQDNQSLLQIAKTKVGDKKELIAGISGTREIQVIANIRNAAELGYTLAMACPPYYYPQNDVAVYDFYSYLVEALPPTMKLILYNIPFCAPSISLEVFKKLLQYDNIVGIKDSSGNMIYFERLITTAKKIRPDFSVYTGQDTTVLPSIMTGAAGVISSGTWMLDTWERQIAQEVNSGNIVKAQELQHWITEILYMLDEIPFPENYRALALCLDFDCGVPQRQFSCLKGSTFSEWVYRTKAILRRYIQCL
jgi:dihydrodipicolinate synthase/N-acetylneuraminate lyase